MIVLRRWMVLVILLLIMALTVPGADSHRDKIRAEATEQGLEATETNVNLNYTDYRLFSLAYIGKDLTSVGLFGQVLIVDQQSIEVLLSAERN